MQAQTPCTDYQETKGLIYFARMLDKIRLNAAGKLAPGYFVGVEDPTFFDSRCTRFLGVNYDELVKRTLEGGSDEEILEWCIANAPEGWRNPRRFTNVRVRMCASFWTVRRLLPRFFWHVGDLMPNR